MVAIYKLGIERAGCLETGGLSVVVDAQPGGDDRHPGIEATFPREGRHGFQGPGERLLSNLIRRLTVPDSLETVPKQPVSVPLVQLVESGPVASLEPLN